MGGEILYCSCGITLINDMVARSILLQSKFKYTCIQGGGGLGFLLLYFKRPYVKLFILI